METRGHAAVVRERVFKDEACHVDLFLPGIGFFRDQSVMEQLKALLAVVVVRIHDRERLLDDVPRGEQRLAGAPGLRAAFRESKAFRQVV